MKKSILAIFPMALFASCSSDLADIVSNQSNSNVEKVTIKTKAFEYEDGTRTDLTATNKGISFAWANGDVLGVFPIAPYTNNQAKYALSFPADCEADAHYASFDGAGWALNSKNSYAAYTPYNKGAESFEEVPLNLTGQDGTLKTIGEKYDFMYAPSAFTSEDCSTGNTHEVVFDFSHSVAILQLKLTMPVAATWKSVTVTNDAGNKVWTTSATMNVATGAVTSTATASSISLALSGVTTTAVGQEVVLYASVLPTTTGALTLTATTSADEEYTASLASKTLVAGKAYRYVISELKAKPKTTGTENGYAWVDLGLPSDLKWATMNVGASSPEEYGNYYAWGETEPQSSNTYDYSSYQWCNGSYSTMTKYCVNSDYGTVDGKTTLYAEDDAATQNWGGAWRMPTHAEQEELLSYCTWEWVTSYNNVSVNGYVVTGSNGNSIFLPAAGYRDYGSLNAAGSNCYYWSSSLVEGRSFSAWVLFLYSTGRYSDYDSRYRGQSVRAVCE